eukprot:TRINITY_DN14709_c0_g1_i1.p1 TRINITY_DN14709_c0_g1~~TRINITY_DN14709_c0_g1_i1.p1  ORF type:complete len:233 (+),score=46.24 TRINITY_DN14709_c0_g1_i1:120-818(+)
METNSGKMKLWHHFPFRSIRCMWLVHELGIEDDIEVVPFFPRFGERGASVEAMEKFKRDVHFHGTVPALQVDDGTGGQQLLRESGAICVYLAERSGRLIPAAGTPERAAFLNWIFYATSTADEYLEPLYWQVVHKKEEDRDTVVVDRSVAKFKEFADYFDKHLGNKEYVCGDFSAADCVLGYSIWWANHCGKSIGLLKDYPKLTAYCERVTAREGFTRCLPQRDGPPPSTAA